MKRRFSIAILGLGLALAAMSCRGASKTDREKASHAAESNDNASLNKNDYPVFPAADMGADPAVPAEQGGKGFRGEGWETNTDFDLIGDPRAVKGGALRTWMLDFPGTLRLEGPNGNTVFNVGVIGMAYETLLGMDPKTLAYVPSLATHWQISPDKMTYRFRINPNARFSDGTPVTADDVVASYDLMVDQTLQDPAYRMTFVKLERPVVETKYIVHVKAKQLNWRNFLYFANSLYIRPAHILKTIDGATYVKDYNFKLIPGSGPYTIPAEDIVKGSRISMRRRMDYWGEKARANVGMYNFDEIRYVVVREEKLAFEMFKKGELDCYSVGRAQEWVNETNFENVQRGLVQKRKVYNDYPQGTNGLALNTRRPPFDDVRVRKAFNFLANRKLMLEKLAFNEYVPLNSYFPGGVYENKDNPQNVYDPELAAKLLAEAGWKHRDSRGRLVKNGQPLEVELLYQFQTFERYFTVYQEALRKAGITLNLRLVTPETQIKLTGERNFQMTYQSWGGLLFPNPETEFDSKLADLNNNNNITAFKNARVDELNRQYDTMFDVQDRIRLIQEIDGIVANDYQYVLFWYGPYFRILYWNRFGAPPGYWSRTGDELGSGNGPGLVQMWWFDSAKQAKLEQAQRDPSIKLEVGPVEDRYWIEFDQKKGLQ